MAWYLGLPGKRGIDIPEHIYDRIAPVANGITLPLWGRPASPEQLQWLHDNEVTEPEDIHKAFNGLPHPHAPSVYGRLSSPPMLTPCRPSRSTSDRDFVPSGGFAWCCVAR